MPQTRSCFAGNCFSWSRNVLIPQELKVVFSIISVPSGKTSLISVAVCPKPFGYCSVIRTGRFSSLAACVIKPIREVISLKSAIFSRNASCMSTMTNAVASAISIFWCAIGQSLLKRMTSRQTNGITRTATRSVAFTSLN